jgi:hypothetical protein
MSGQIGPAPAVTAGHATVLLLQPLRPSRPLREEKIVSREGRQGRKGRTTPENLTVDCMRS